LEITKKKSWCVIMSKVCERCGKDFSCDPYWTSSLRRHLARKNPCDRPLSSKYIKDSSVKSPVCEVRFLDSVTVPENLLVPPHLPHAQIAPWFFEKVFSDPMNVCFVKMNKSKNEIIVRVSKDSPAQVVTIDEFIKLFVNHVFLKHFKVSESYDMFLCDNYIYSLSPWRGDFPDGKIYVRHDGTKHRNTPDFMIAMRLGVKSMFELTRDKTKLKNILLRL